MRNKQKSITPLLAALAAAAFATAPIAAAAPSATQSGTVATQSPDPSAPTQAQQSCTSLGSSQTDCQSPGNAQVFVAPSQEDYFTYRGGAT